MEVSNTEVITIDRLGLIYRYDHFYNYHHTVNMRVMIADKLRTSVENCYPTAMKPAQIVNIPISKGQPPIMVVE